MIQGTLSLRLQKRSQEKYIIDEIMPSGEVHLIGGASGAGKTTWLLHLLKDWSEGKPVLGRKSHPVPFVYVSFDRGLATLDRTLRRLNLGQWDFPAYDVADLGLKELSLFAIVDKFPVADLFVIEGFQGCVKDAAKGTSQNKSDMLWSADVRKKITNKNKTILGITHSPKMKQGESYVSSRSRFLGTQSLLASTGTLITFDNPPAGLDASGNPARTDDREVLIEGPNFPPLKILYTRGANGRFVEMASDAVGEELNFDAWLDRRTFDESLPAKTIIEIGLKTGMSSRDAVNRRILKMVEDGILERVEGSRGVYRKRRVV